MRRIAAESLGFALLSCIAKPRKIPRTCATAFQKPKSGKPNIGPPTYESIWRDSQEHIYIYSNFMRLPYFALGKLDDGADFEPDKNCYERADFHIDNPTQHETISQEAQKRKTSTQLKYFAQTMELISR